MSARRRKTTTKKTTSSGPGWIRQHRTDLTSGILRNHDRYIFVCYLKLKAAYRSCDVMVGLQKVHLEPGQLIFGRQQAAHDIALSERQIRGHLDALKASGYVSVKATNKFSIITLLNWEVEQKDPPEEGQQKGQQNAPDTSGDTPPARPATGHIQEVRMNKEKGKKVKQHTWSPDGDRVSVAVSDLPKYTPDFERYFWKHYPRKVKKKAAFEVWQQLNLTDDERIAINDALEWQCELSAWQYNEEDQYIPHPDKYLRDRRWEDEPPEQKWWQEKRHIC